MLRFRRAFPTADKHQRVERGRTLWFRGRRGRKDRTAWPEQPFQSLRGVRNCRKTVSTWQQRIDRRCLRIRLVCFSGRPVVHHSAGTSGHCLRPIVR